MNKALSLFIGLCASAFSAVAGSASFDGASAASPKCLSGSLTLGYDTLANDRGVVLSHSVLGGDGSPIGALKYNYDFGQEGKWSWDGMLYFRDVVSGHRLYGDPGYGGPLSNQAQMALAANSHGLLSPPLTPQQVAQYQHIANHGRIKQANAESEWVLQNGLKYTQDKWNVAFGHTFIRGGVLGVFAKHFRNQGASTLNEAFIRTEVTPAPWFALGVDVRRGISGIDGWWFLPDVTFKAPLYKEGDKVKVAAVLKLAMAATSDYFDHTDSACNNGSQAYYMKLNTPWFVTDHFILTPGVGLHWLGKGAIHCNKRSKFAMATGNPTYVPFRNFAVVGSISATYKF